MDVGKNSLTTRRRWHCRKRFFKFFRIKCLSRWQRRTSPTFRWRC